MVDPMATLPIPPGHGLVDANLIRWEKLLHSVFIEIFDEVINKSPVVLLQCHLRWTIAWLITKPDAHPQVIKLLLWHPCQAK